MAPTRRKKSGRAKNKTSMVKSANQGNQPAPDPFKDINVLLQTAPDVLGAPKSGNSVNLPMSTPSSSSLKPVSQKSSGSRSKTKAAKSYTSGQLLEKAEELMDSFDFELAEKFCIRAIELDPKNATACVLRGSILTELGRLEEAQEAFRKAMEIDPVGDYTCCLSFAQLVYGKESADAYKKAISLIEAALYGPSKKDDGAHAETADLDEKSVARMKSDLSSAYCALAELYMTDLCDEDKAEDECLECIRSAIAVDENNPEGFQSMASLHLVKGALEEAKAFLKKSLDLWLEKYKAAHSDEGTDGDEIDAVINCPLTYSARVGAAKLCMELDMFDEGAEVLNCLIDEDDEDEETWYLLGYMNFLKGEENWASAKYFFVRAQEVIKKKGVADEAMEKSLEETLTQIRASGHVSDSDDSDLEEDVADALDDLDICSSDEDDGKVDDDVESGDEGKAC